MLRALLPKTDASTRKRPPEVTHARNVEEFYADGYGWSSDDEVPVVAQRQERPAKAKARKARTTAPALPIAPPCDPNDFGSGRVHYAQFAAVITSTGLGLSAHPDGVPEVAAVDTEALAPLDTPLDAELDVEEKPDDQTPLFVF
jgi:hypothetical protein